MWHGPYFSQRVQTDHMAETEAKSDRLHDGEECAQRSWPLYPRVLRQPHGGKAGIWLDISLDPGFVSSLCSCLCRLGLSLAVVLFRLHGRDNNRCAGLKEIRLRDPQLKINKKLPTTHVSYWLWHLYSQSKKLKKIQPELPAFQKDRLALLIGQSEAGCLQIQSLHERIIKMAIFIFIKYYALGLFQACA